METHRTIGTNSKDYTKTIVKYFKPGKYIFQARPVFLLAVLLWMCLWANPARSQQLQRIGYAVGIAQSVTPSAAAALGGAANAQVDMLNACAGANVVQQNSGTGVYWKTLGFYVSTNDPTGLDGSGTLSWLSGNAAAQDVRNFGNSLGANLLDVVGTFNNVSGIAYQPGYYSALSAASGAWYVVFAHELGHNFGCAHADGLGGTNPFRTIMLHNYCSGSDIDYYTNPSLYYNGIRLLGTLSQDCGTGSLVNNGNNAGVVALAAPGKNNAAVFSAMANFNPLLTAVHCGGAAVGTTNTDQRTFAADQNYTGGTAWNANGYSYAVDVSGVTNPAPQTAYQDQRYGNMTYTFTNYLPGTNYLVRLHCMECCWNAAGQRVFNVLVNGVNVLSNFDIYATAGAQDKAVIREIPATADVNGRIVVQFVNVVDNASISAIEILQGGLYVPINLTATPGVAQVSLNWSPVAGVTGYNVKRATLSGGPYVTVGSTASTNYNDNPLAATTTYYYVVSAVKGGNESFNSIETSITTPVTVNSDTWAGGSGNNFSTVANWAYAIGSGPVSNADALVFGSVGSTAPYNDETGFGYSSITFNPDAQSYTIGGNAFMLGTNSVGPIITVNSSNPQTINNNLTLVGGSQTISTAAGNLTLGGNVSGTGSLALAGSGTLNIPVSGVVTIANTLTVGSAATNAVLNVLGGHLTGVNFNIGAVSGAVGAVYQNGGTVTAAQTANSTDFQIGNAASAFGYYAAGAGTLAVNEIGLGGEANPGNAIMDVNGATVNVTGWLVISRAGAAQTGILNVYSGSINYGTTGGGGLACNWGAGQTAIVNVMGGTVANTANVGINLNISGTAGNSGTLNLNGGSVQANSVTGTPGGRVNFNGGTLKPSASSTAFMVGLNSANIYGGGATINNTVFTTITIGQALLAPTGNGINGIASFTGGAGYIAPPIVTIIPGAGDSTGVGATAIAQINPASGVVTNVVITCPGVNYTAIPTFMLSGGGATTPATITGQAPTPNVSGGLTKIGAGVLTLTNVNTYAGDTLINGGTLALSGGGSISNSADIVVGSGAIFNLSAVAGYTLNTAQALRGFGTVKGAVIVNGTIAPGAGGVGTLILSNTPALNGVMVMRINRNGGAFTNDQIKLPSSGITCGGTLVVTNIGAHPLVAGDTFQLFSATSYGGAFAATNLPPLGNNLYWTNQLAINGTLGVVGLVSTVPTNIVWSLSGTNLVLSWPADNTGWRLMMQTNHLSSGLSLNSNDWAAVPNSPGTNQISLPIDPTQTDEFYRLVYP